MYSRSIWVILGPYSDKLVQVVSAQYGRISRQIVEIVHNNSHKQVQHLQIKNEFSNMWLISPTIWSKKMRLSKSFTTSTVCECACFRIFVSITASILWTVLLWYLRNLIVTVEKWKYGSCHCTKEKSEEFLILLSQAQASVQTKLSV